MIYNNNWIFEIFYVLNILKFSIYVSICVTSICQ